MALPGGLRMADLGEDRDGLTLDRLHVPLGPALSDWPAGLVVHAVLQGDVVQEAEVEVLDAAAAASFWDSTPAHPAARELDALARLLAVAGWPDAAADARRRRDALLAGPAPERVVAGTERLLQRVRRSRTLRWLVRGIPAGPYDVAELVDGRLAAVDAALRGASRALRRPGPDVLPALLAGAELAAARLIVAAVDPDVDAVVSSAS